MESLFNVSVLVLALKDAVELQKQSLKEGSWLQVIGDGNSLLGEKAEGAEAVQPIRSQKLLLLFLYFSDFNFIYFIYGQYLLSQHFIHFFLKIPPVTPPRVQSPFALNHIKKLSFVLEPAVAS